MKEDRSREPPGSETRGHSRWFGYVTGSGSSVAGLDFRQLARSLRAEMRKSVSVEELVEEL
jgi:hypothetical protein